MEIITSNRIRIKDPDERLKELLINDLRLPNPKFDSAQKNGYSTYGIKQFIHNFSILPDDSLSIPRGYRRQLFALIKELGLRDVKVTDKRFLAPPRFGLDSSNISLRPYQFDAIKNLSISGDEGLLIAPAGSGKTVMGISLIPMLGQSMLWLVHTKPLLTQAITRAKMFLPDLTDDDIGVIGDGQWSIGNVLTVGMTQTLVRRPVETHGLKGRFGIVIVDEAHHTPATTFTKVISSLDPYYLYGLTATHLRRDGLHTMMFQVLGPVLHEVPLEEVKSYGGIIVPQIICRNTGAVPDAEDFASIVKSLVNNTARTNFIVSDIVAEAGRGNICVVVTERRNHAEILYNHIAAKWPKVGIAIGQKGRGHNETTLEDLEAGRITVLVTTSALLGEGFDYAPINRGFICLPFRNLVKTEQIIGRLQRTAEGKQDAVVYDYLDSHSLCRHQFKNNSGSACRCSIYEKLGCSIREL